MTEDAGMPASKRAIWIRALYMLLMALVLHVTVTVVFCVAIIQFILALLSAPNDRLQAFGRNLGIYLRQLTDFLTFATEGLPFPFTEWPSGS